MKFADRYADATYKYLKWYGTLVYFTNKYENPPRWSIGGFVHDTLQAITEIQRVYTGGKPVKWGCKDSEEVIDKMVESARKLKAISDKIESKGKANETLL